MFLVPYHLFLHPSIPRVRLSNSYYCFHLPLAVLSIYSSISSIRSSPSREASAVTWTAFTVPATGEFTTVSIFMADRTHSGWPFSTFWSRRKEASQTHGPLNKHVLSKMHPSKKPLHNWENLNVGTDGKRERARVDTVLPWIWEEYVRRVWQDHDTEARTWRCFVRCCVYAPQVACQQEERGILE